jgi:GTP-binding protein
LIPSDAENWGDEYQILVGELEKYNPELLHKRRVLVVSKMDLSIPEMEEEMRESLPKDLPLVFISSVTNTGIQELKDLLWETLQEENKDVAKQVESSIEILPPAKLATDSEEELA